MAPTDGNLFEIFNYTDTDIPLGGVCVGSGGYTDRGELKVVAPTADSQRYLIVVVGAGIRARSAGIGSHDLTHLLAFDATEGVPARGDEVGSVSGSFLVSMGQKGFYVYGAAKFGWCSAFSVETLSPLTTKGDVWVYGTEDARLPVGTTGYVMTADPLDALGVSWQESVSGSGFANYFAGWSATKILTYAPATWSGSAVTVPGTLTVGPVFPSVSVVLTANGPIYSYSYVYCSYIDFTTGGGTLHLSPNAAHNAFTLDSGSGVGSAPLTCGDITCTVSAGSLGVINAATRFDCGLASGVSGTIGPGATATGGVITSVGSGSFVSLGTANTWTATQTFQPSTNVVPVVAKSSAGGTADLFQAKSSGGTTLAKIDVSGNLTAVGGTFSAAVGVTGTVSATTFSGSGASLTNLPAAQVTGTLDGGTW